MTPYERFRRRHRWQARGVCAVLVMLAAATVLVPVIGQLVRFASAVALVVAAALVAAADG